MTFGILLSVSTHTHTHSGPCGPRALWLQIMDGFHKWRGALHGGGRNAAFAMLWFSAAPTITEFHSASSILHAARTKHKQYLTEVCHRHAASALILLSPLCPLSVCLLSLSRSDPVVWERDVLLHIKPIVHCDVYSVLTLLWFLSVTHSCARFGFVLFLLHFFVCLMVNYLLWFSSVLTPHQHFRH